MLRKKDYIYIVLAVLGGYLLILYIEYVSHNNSGHSGLNPYFLIIPFLLILGVTAYLCIVRDQNNINYYALLPIITCLFGITFIICLVQFNILKEKSHWIHTGMLPPPDWSNKFLTIYTQTYWLLMLLLVGGGLLRSFGKIKR